MKPERRLHPKKKKTAKQISLQSLRAKALELSASGLSMRRVAAEMGCSVSTVHEYIERALRDIPAPNVALKREVEDEKLHASDERLLEIIAFARRVMSDPATEPEAALDAAARLCDAERTKQKNSERRAKLFGLDAPVRTEVTGKDGGPLSSLVIEPTQADAARIVREHFGRVAPDASTDTGSPPSTGSDTST